MDRMRAQAERWGARLLTEDVERVDLSERPFTVSSGDSTVRAHAVVVATGATAKRLGLPSEDRFWSAGHLRVRDLRRREPGLPQPAAGGRRRRGHRGRGGALSDEIRIARPPAGARVGSLRASRAMAERVLEHPRVTVHYNTSIRDAVGSTSMTALDLIDPHGRGQGPAARQGSVLRHRPRAQHGLVRGPDRARRRRVCRQDATTASEGTAPRLAWRGFSRPGMSPTRSGGRR